jgi:hypothetical protein
MATERRPTHPVRVMTIPKAEAPDEDPVVLAAQAAFAVRVRASSDVSENTKNAQAICKSWRKAVHDLDADRLQIEALVTPELDQKIDIIDSETRWAYEFKVSGKNAWAEFYKDVVKILIWNDKRSKKLAALVFITEESFGRRFVDGPMARGTSHGSQSITDSKSGSPTCATVERTTLRVVSACVPSVMVNQNLILGFGRILRTALELRRRTSDTGMSHNRTAPWLQPVRANGRGQQLR